MPLRGTGVSRQARQPGGTRRRRFIGINFKQRKLPENVQSPTCWLHAVLDRLCACLTEAFQKNRFFIYGINVAIGVVIEGMVSNAVAEGSTGVGVPIGGFLI